MTLQQALEWLMSDKAPWVEEHIAELGHGHDATAIATILNAVVKGELKDVGDV